MPWGGECAFADLSPARLVSRLVSRLARSAHSDRWSCSSRARLLTSPARSGARERVRIVLQRGRNCGQYAPMWFGLGSGVKGVVQERVGRGDGRLWGGVLRKSRRRARGKIKIHDLGRMYDTGRSDWHMNACPPTLLLYACLVIAI